MLAALAAFWVALPRQWRAWLPGSGPRVKSLAVLPLTNLSGDPAQEFFADGMTEVLITDLAQINSLRVISRTSMMRFKGSKKSLPEIARQLHVDAVIEGSVLRSGEQVRITAELIEASTDQHLWTRVYERKLDDVLALQGEVAGAIAVEIKAKITPQESARLTRSRPVNTAAQDEYLKGRFYWSEFNADSLQKSLEHYQEAIRLDPGYAAAFAGLSEAWTGLGRIGAVSWEEIDPKAREAATKALSLDDSLSEAHAAMGALHARVAMENGRSGEPQGDCAESRVPNRAHGVQQHFTVPGPRRGKHCTGAPRGRTGSPGRAHQPGPRQCLCQRPPVRPRHRALPDHHRDSSRGVQSVLPAGWAYVYKGQYGKGVEEIGKSIALDGGDPSLSPDLAYIDAVTGKTAEARAILGRLLEMAKQVPVNPGLIAFIYAGLGERDNTFTWLERAYAVHSPMMIWLKVDPRFDKIRSEPRFQELMRHVSLI